MNRPDTAYQIKAGNQTASSNARESDRQLLQMTLELGMDGVGGWCNLELVGGEFAALAIGSEIQIRLDNGSGMVTVFAGQADWVETGLSNQRWQGSDAIARLGRIEFEAAYQDVYADFIIKDILKQVDADIGSIAKGPNFPAYVLHRGPRALAHVQALARLCGADLYSDGAGAVHCATPREGRADHVFRFGENILALNLQQMVWPYDSVEVWGEGAAGQAGAEKAHWLVNDLSSVSARAKLDASGKVVIGQLGQRPLQIKHGALRSSGSAEDVAKARMSQVAARAISGQIEVVPSPAVMPGDLIELQDLPQQHALSQLLGKGRSLRVRTVRHVLDRSRGFITYLGL